MAKEKRKFAGIPIEDVITKPLLAISKAQNSMSREQMELILHTCFMYNGHAYVPITLEMELTRSVMTPGQNLEEDPHLVVINSQFKVPLITIFPINILGIDNVNISFDLDITSQYALNAEEEEDNHSAFKSEGKRIEMKGKLNASSVSPANTKDTSAGGSHEWSRSTNFNVNVEASNQPLPTGLLEIIALYSKSIHPSKISEDKP